jgi:hypothetical protein
MESEETGEIIDEEVFEAVSVGKIIENYPEEKKPINNEKKSADKASQKTWHISIARRPSAYYISKRAT